MVSRVFAPVDRSWRGIGVIPRSGLGLREEFSDMDARRRLGLEVTRAAEPAGCRAGEVLQGCIKPLVCPAFGVACTPEQPLGAPMVSSEGACAVYYNNHRHQVRAGEMQ
jgi:hydrogenase expression/formation protein HypD